MSEDYSDWVMTRAQAIKRVIELEAQDEVHWKTRRTLLADLRRADAELAELTGDAYQTRVREQQARIDALETQVARYKLAIEACEQARVQTEKGLLDGFEAAMREACGYLTKFIVEGDSRQEQSVDEFLVRWTEFSGVTSNAFTSERHGEPK